MQRNKREAARTSIGSDAAYDITSRQGSVARSTLHHAAHRACDQVAGASNRSPRVLGGHTHASTGPPTVPPAGRPGRAGATRGGVGATGYVVDAPPPPRCCGRLRASAAPLIKKCFVGVCQIICPCVLTLLTRKMH